MASPQTNPYGPEPRELRGPASPICRTPSGKKADHPPDSPRSQSHAPVLMSTDEVSTRRQRFACARLPGPHLTHLVRIFLIAHHDSLQLTQHEAVWSHPPPDGSEGPRTFILHVAPLQHALPTSATSTFRTHEITSLNQSRNPHSLRCWLHIPPHHDIGLRGCECMIRRNRQLDALPHTRSRYSCA